VRQPIVAMGRQMAELLLRQVGDQESAPSRVIFPTELVVRESSAPRAAGAAGEPSDRVAGRPRRARPATSHVASAGG